MKTGKFTLLLILIVVLSVIVSTVLYALNLSPVKEVRNIPMYLEVGEGGAAFNLDDTNQLHFGRSTPGGSISRKMDISHQYGYPLQLEINAKGELSEWLRVSENYILLESSEKRKLEFVVEIPDDAELGNYTGTVSITLKNPGS